MLFIDNPIHAFGKTIHLSASPIPNLPFIAKYYVWNFGDGSSEPVFYNVTQHFYKLPGR